MSGLVHVGIWPGGQGDGVVGVSMAAAEGGGGSGIATAGAGAGGGSGIAAAGAGAGSGSGASAGAAAGGPVMLGARAIGPDDGSTEIGGLGLASGAGAT